jgi:hypothetical protein
VLGMTPLYRGKRIYLQERRPQNKNERRRPHFYFENKNNDLKKMEPQKKNGRQPQKMEDDL